MTSCADLQHKPKVLVVDDEIQVINQLKVALQSVSQVFFATDSTQVVRFRDFSVVHPRIRRPSFNVRFQAANLTVQSSASGAKLTFASLETGRY
nr:hypothetical protein [uncultured Albidiferax sp.]